MKGKGETQKKQTKRRGNRENLRSIIVAKGNSLSVGAKKSLITYRRKEKKIGTGKLCSCRRAPPKKKKRQVLNFTREENLLRFHHIG